MDKFQVAIFSVEGDKIEIEAGLVILPGVNGHVGIMPNMVPYATLLKAGCIYIVSDAGGLKKKVFINKGKALMANNVLSVSVDDKVKTLEDYTLDDVQKERVDLEAKLKNEALANMHDEYKTKLEDLELLVSLKKGDVYSFR